MIYFILFWGITLFSKCSMKSIYYFGHKKKNQLIKTLGKEMNLPDELVC